MAVPSWSAHMSAPDYDQPAQPTNVRYIICGSPRSGTSLLCSYLYNVGAGVPIEYFDQEFVGPVLGKRWYPGQFKLHVNDYIRALHDHRTRNSILGIKVLWHQFGENMNAWHESFPETKYIWVRRHNLLQQAVSGYIAQTLDFWSSLEEDDKRPEPPPYSFLRIDNMRLIIQEQNYNWDIFLKDKNPCSVWYEELVSDPAFILARAMNWLGDPLPQPYKIGEPKTRKIRDEVDQKYREYYRHDLEELVGL